jgi:cell division transport system ATP-binding protein
MQENLPLDVIIELTNCSIWQQNHLVLSNVNLRVGKGEFLYLVGRVGSGKSSLIKTLNAQIPLKEGTGLVAGYDLAKIKKREIPYLRRKIGIVFQDFQLLTDRTVNANLEFVLKATGWKNKIEMDNRISEVLEKVGLGLKGNKMPH